MVEFLEVGTIGVTLSSKVVDYVPTVSIVKEANPTHAKSSSLDTTETVVEPTVKAMSWGTFHAMLDHFLMGRFVEI